MRAATKTVRCRLELFGVPRLAAGCKAVDLVLAENATLADAVAAAAQVCPALVGKAIAADGRLAEGYVLNLEGRSFCADLSRPLRDGATVLLLAGEAGG
ncbi:MAG: thiamine biosynthesis protein ThiS [Chloroflexi bacterium]|nr:thiamine biosynthesis protein ThiS [Chloroflexota bacterium]